MRILVAGASGVLGRALVPLLVAAGHQVRCFSRRPLRGGDAEWSAADLLSSDLAPLVRGCDVVIHAATAIPPVPSTPGAWDLNTALRTTGTRRLLAACRAAGVRRYVQQSIVMIYADGGDVWLDESAPIDPSGRNAAPVLDMEAQVQQSALSWAVLRGGQFVGPGTGAEEHLISGVVPCDGGYWYPAVYVADYAAAVALAAASSEVGIFNVTAEPVLYATFVDALAARAGREPPLRDPSRACPPSRRVSSAKFRQTFAWSPRQT
jgi:nucleoside-diphosphate-sugar epimerase